MTTMRIKPALGVVLVLALGLLLVPQASGPGSTARGQDATGQTAILLPDGRWLMLGGQGPDGPLSAGAIWDPATQTSTPLGSRLQHPRAGHSATVLADGTVLIVGGLGADGRVVLEAERFDPAAQRFEVVTGVDRRMPASGRLPGAECGRRMSSSSLVASKRIRTRLYCGCG